MKTATRDDLTARVSAQAMLVQMGWTPGLISGLGNDGEVTELFVATHPLYPRQTALTVSELVRRCAWEEDNRPVKRH